MMELSFADTPSQLLTPTPPPWLNPETLSPDPTQGRQPDLFEEGSPGYWLHPHRLLRGPDETAVRQWESRLHVLRDPGELCLATLQGVCDLTLDFGTELDGYLVIEVDSAAPVAITARFGESVAEVEGLIENHAPFSEDYWHAPGGGRHEHRFDQSYWTAWSYGLHKQARGFRMVRLRLVQAQGPVRLRIRALAIYTCPAPQATFVCDDKRMQRVWHAAAYTVRLCTRPDGFWDGIKRDRGGWYGDARPAQAAMDRLLLWPEPTEAMLSRLPTDQWVNGVPVYSFDAIAMLYQLQQAHRLPAARLRPLYQPCRALLNWVMQTQLNARGFITRDDQQKFFFDIGFLDWSTFPVGGRFEELAWIQLKHLEALRLMTRIAAELGESEDAHCFAARAEALQATIIRHFWQPGVGFIHTLNHVGQVPNQHLPGYDGHYRRSYIEKTQLGPSGPSRHVNAWAVLAGACDIQMRATILKQVLNNPALPGIITPYFAWYEQQARALCGDRAGAVRHLVDYLADMLETENSPTLWELWDPLRRGQAVRFNSSFSWGFHCSTSLCHAWGAGVIDVLALELLGISNNGGTGKALSPDPASDLSIGFQAEIPTARRGMVRVCRESTIRLLRIF